MNRISSTFPKVILIFILYCLTLSRIDAQKKLNASIETKIDGLLKTMTLEEKVGQTAQVSIESLGRNDGQSFSFSDKMKDAVINFKIGSVLNTPGPLQSASDWNRIISELQYAAKQTKTGIPILYG